MNLPRSRVCREYRGILVGILGPLVFLLLVAPIPAAHAQSETVGRIEEMKRAEMPVDSTADVRLTATPIYTRKPARRRDALHVRELVELLEPYYVRASLDYGRVRSRIVVGSTGAQIGAVELQRRGAYEIYPNRVDPLSGLELRIRHGVVLVEHAAGRLDAWVSGTLTSIFGTQVLFAVDSTSADALLFLRKGHIDFPEYGIVVRGENSTWQLRDGVAPERLSLPVAAQRQLIREVDFLADEVWRGPRPFYTKPGFYLPAGAVLLGAGVLLLTTGGDGDGGRVSGEAIIFIPD